MSHVVLFCLFAQITSLRSFRKGRVVMEGNANQFLGEEKIGSLMRQYAIPCIISLLVGALYNIVDQIFIANAAYLGSYGNAANTVVFPLTVIALSIAVMIGDGCCAFVSISLGKGQPETARKSVGNSIVMVVLSGLILGGIYLIFRDPIIAMFGGTVNEETFHHAGEYFFYIALGVPFYMFGQALNPIIRADGSPRFAMVSTLAGAVVNIILDPLFIFVCKWGMMGAAVATVMGQVVTAALAVWYILHMKLVKPGKADFQMEPDLCRETLVLGVTSLLSQISLVAAMAAINNMVRKYGALDPVFGQTDYAQIPMVGYVAAGQPILAEENIQDYFPMPADMLPNSQVFMLKVRGDSMIEAGILDGDQVIVKQTNQASNGDMVVALIEDGATVKTFYKEKDHIRLQPENPDYDPIIVSDVQILGQVIGVFRMF